MTEKPEEIREETCANCAYWHNKPDTRFGECRKYAPKLSEYLTSYKKWATTEAFDWCGEWGTKEEAKIWPEDDDWMPKW